MLGGVGEETVVFRALSTLLPHPASNPNLVFEYSYQKDSSLSKIVKDYVILNDMQFAVIIMADLPLGLLCNC